MRYLLSIATMVVFFGFHGVAQNATTPPAALDPDGAKIEFVKDTIDYGTIEQNSEPFRTFHFKNTGKKDLVISKSTHGSCGCTVPEIPTEPVKPGKTGEMRVRYATDRIGQFSKNVTVESNAITGNVVVWIKGNVLPKKDDGTKPADTAPKPNK